MSLPEQMSMLSQLCEGAISPVFFHQVVGVLPVLLLTLGIEFNYSAELWRTQASAPTAATVTVMAAGLVGALSTLRGMAKDAVTCCPAGRVHGVPAIGSGNLHWLGHSGVAVGRQYTDDVTGSDTLSKSG
jgi:hypothetical protein